ncbi:hypothetical protein QD47_26510 [Paenibacillus terrae]|uniref:Uncharacterized protein n=1 Tax=Paenibacillus terrae TaxID=159743 RepID=A0A0D7WYD9_9BACL|nr:hypothetical protein QD47_26510 [Paenibacillus terrae]
MKKSPKPGICMLCNDPNPNPEHTTMGTSFCDTCWDVMKSGDRTNWVKGSFGTSDIKKVSKSQLTMV